MFRHGQKTTRKQFLKVLLSCIFAFSTFNIPALASNPYGPFPTQYYVSKNGDNSDGKSWATAWNEMDQIKWNQINVQWGDRIVIDGGATRMVYRTPLHIQSSIYDPFAPMRVSLSDEPGHNGRAIIYGAGKAGPGLRIGGSNIQVKGTKAKGITICGWRGVGVSMPSGTGTHNIVQYLEICSNRGIGLHFQGGFNAVVTRCIIHDNRLNVLVNPSGPINGAIGNSWIYNSSYRVNSDGIIMGDGINLPHVSVTSCVIGPGLRGGFHFKGGDQYGATLSNCLFINATRSNISSAKGLYVDKCTSFMTRANPWKKGHACVRIQASQPNYPLERISNSIFYGGGVRVNPAIQSYNVSNNTQYKTRGNTTFLSSSQVDPMFVTNVGRYPNNVSIRRLINTDFSIKSGSPAAGTGSTITSVKKLFKDL